MPHRRTFAPGIHALRSLGPACASASSLRLSAHAGSRGTGNPSQCLDRQIAGVILYPHETAYALSGIVITMPVWSQVYDPLGSQVLSTLVALLPLVVLLGLLAFAGWSGLRAAAAGLATALAIAVGVVGMPVDAALAAALHGAAFGLFPIGWIILAAMFLYAVCVEAGALDVMKRSVIRLSADHRVQALLIAFSFGAFLEGAAGFGAPVAISAASP